MFFYTEHIEGHRKNFCTPEDPTSARMGENFYAYLWRSSIGIVRFLIDTECKTLERNNKKFFQIDNPTLWYILLPLLLMATLVLALGSLFLPYFIGQSVVAYIALEFISYIEHYGLVRQNIAGEGMNGLSRNILGMLISI